MTAATALSRGRTPHPGRTFHEEKVIDFVGAKLGHPGVPNAVIEKLIADGLLIRSTKTMRDALGYYEVPVYSLPDKVRLQWEDYWCDRVAEEA